MKCPGCGTAFPAGEARCKACGHYRETPTPPAGEDEPETKRGRKRKKTPSSDDTEVPIRAAPEPEPVESPTSVFAGTLLWVGLALILSFYVTAFVKLGTVKDGVLDPTARLWAGIRITAFLVGVVLTLGAWRARRRG